MSAKSIPIVVLILLFALQAAAVLAEGDSNVEHKVWKRYDVSVGGFFNAVNSNVMLGAEGVGVNIDVEDLLGLESRTTVFRASGSWRYTENRRHRLDLSWFAVRRGTDHVIDRNIELGDTLFLEGTHLKSSFDLDIFRAAYSYSFFQDERVDLALSAGLFIMPIGFEAQVTQDSTRSVRSSDITAPLPVFGFSTDVALTPRWHLLSGLHVFYIEIGNFKGAISDLMGAAEYNVYENMALGLGFESFGMNVEAQGEDYPGIDFEGRIDFRYIGLTFYVKGMW